MLGKLPDARYAALDAQYAKEKESLSGEITELEKAIAGYEQSRKSVEKFIALVDKYENFVIGDCFSLNEAVQLEIKNKHSLSVKVSSIVRNKLLLSEKEYLQLITSGQIKSIPDQDLKKCKLKEGVTLFL